MEVDSLHASIENASRNVSVNSVSDWKNIFKLARKKRVQTFNDEKHCVEPYKVREFKYDEMLDLKQLAQQLIKNREKDNLNEKVNWMKLKRLKYVKGEKSKIFFNYDLSEEFRFIKVHETVKNHGTKTRKRGNISENDHDYPQEIPRLYNEPLPITEAKKKDLVTMCRKRIIPEELHAQVVSLKTTSSKHMEVSDQNASIYVLQLHNFPNKYHKYKNCISISWVKPDKWMTFYLFSRKNCLGNGSIN